MRTFLEAQDLLAQTLPGYEARPHQQAFAERIERAIDARTHLLAEAGTGTGKSLGYLIPAVLSGKRVVVSTATKALQTQIWEKDIPFLQENLTEFRAAVLKGRSNYLCVNKLQDADPADVPHLQEFLDLVAIPEHTDAALAEYPINVEWSGERDDLGFEVEHREWMKVSAEADDCKSYDCSENGNCYAQLAKGRAKAAQVVVVNHALYMTDLVVKEITGGNASLIGEHQILVADEAHEWEEYAGNTLGSTFKEIGVRNLMGEVRNFIERNVPGQEASEVLQGMAVALADLWDILEEGRIRQITLVEHADEFVNFANALEDLHDYIADPRLLDMVPGDSYTKVKKRRERIQAKVTSMAKRFGGVVTDSFEDLVRWVEVDSRGNKAIRTAPVNVAPYLRDHLFGPGHITAIMVSATLSVNNDFRYIAGRLGIDRHDSLDVGTPFDYQAQAATYVPNLPDPTKEREVWSAMSINEMLDLVRASEGRALLLFTSFSEMRAAYDTISSRVPYRCMMQGEASNKVLAQNFKDDEHSVLFATRSFMTGVDFQGDTLKLVIINKLPFPVPTEPLTEARCESIKRRGGNDFAEYSVPVMTLVLKQAYGRLIRHRNDTGVVAILDPRLHTKGYGRAILASLPDAPVVTEMSLVEARLGVPEPDPIPFPKRVSDQEMTEALASIEAELGR